MSFGNSASTVRMFKRVSSSDDSGHSKPPSSHGYVDSPQDSIFDVDSENRPPPQKQYLHSSPVVAATKESVLGRRTYAKCIEPALQEAQATTADRTKREALSRVAESWSRLDELDPEGELLLLKSMLERISNDPKVAAALLPQLQNLRSPSPTKKPSLVSSTTSTLVNADSADILSTSSPSKLPSSRRNSELPGLSKYQQQHTPISSSPPKQYSHSREPSSPSKLVMNPQNPHLKRMRSSQPEVPIVTPEREKGLPGGKQEPGMEHVGFVAEALYGRWAEGLRGRWGMMG
jgi:serine/threonine-protein kinase 24/25/MST4